MLIRQGLKRQSLQISDRPVLTLKWAMWNCEGQHKLKTMVKLRLHCIWADDISSQNVLSPDWGVQNLTFLKKWYLKCLLKMSKCWPISLEVNDNNGMLTLAIKMVVANVSCAIYNFLNDNQDCKLMAKWNFNICKVLIWNDCHIRSWNRLDKVILCTGWLYWTIPLVICTTFVELAVCRMEKMLRVINAWLNELWWLHCLTWNAHCLEWKWFFESLMIFTMRLFHVMCV